MAIECPEPSKSLNLIIDCDNIPQSVVNCRDVLKLIKASVGIGSSVRGTMHFSEVQGFLDDIEAAGFSLDQLQVTVTIGGAIAKAS